MSDNKIVERVRKLLALAADGSGATEAEAQSAAAKAAEIMEEAGLTAMAVEMAGGQGEARGSGVTQVDAPAWYKQIVDALAETCFCHVDLVRLGKRQFEFRLIGRLSSVTTVCLTFDYLRKTIWTLSRRAQVDSQHHFRCGMAERIAERIQTRHTDRLQEQRREAQERSARAATSSPGSSSGTALVVTLVDHERRERDLNEDFRRGLKPGTTEQARRDTKARSDAVTQRISDLIASGVSEGVAFNMVHLGHTRERAEAYEKEWLEAQERSAKKSRRRSNSNWTKGDEARWQAHRRKESRKQSQSWREGRSTGETVGLETQVDLKGQRRIT